MSTKIICWVCELYYVETEREKYYGMCERCIHDTKEDRE